MKNPKENVGKKRRELSTIVRQTIKKEGGDRFKLEWDKMLEDQLLVGYVILKGDGNVMSLYTLNDSNADFMGLSGFNSVDIVVIGKYDGPINKLSNDGQYNGLAESISKNLKKHGYTSQVRIFKD